MSYPRACFTSPSSTQSVRLPDEMLSSARPIHCLSALRTRLVWCLVTTLLGSATALSTSSLAADTTTTIDTVHIGPRPFALRDQLPAGELQDALNACDTSKIQPQPFSIGHRGAPLQFPEHTREGYIAAARMGAGVIECDVTFTADRELVCRHSQCDLHTTTNILETPLAENCSVPPDMNSSTPFSDVRCCTSDITVAEFKTLRGKMDAGNPNAATLAEYMDATPSFRTDLYASHGTLLTHRESIELFDALGVSMTPELKEAMVDMPFDEDYTQQTYATQMISEYKAAAIAAERVFPQSFNMADIDHWLRSEPTYGAQAVWLDGRYADSRFDPGAPESWTPSMSELTERGLRFLAPPLYMLVTTDEGRMVPSAYALAARKSGLDLIAWSLERSGSLARGGDFYYQSVADIVDDDSDALLLLDVFGRDIGVSAVFSDWPATTTYYAHCLLENGR